MLETINSVLSDEDCQEIIEISHTVENWNVVHQSDSSVDTVKCYIKPYIWHILKKLPIDIPENCCVELVKYCEGARNEVHIDSEGDHTLAPKEWIRVEWKRTGIVLLNDEFESGRLYFPIQATAFGKETKGDLILFSAGKNSHAYAHGVEEVQNGTRYTLVFRFI